MIIFVPMLPARLCIGLVLLLLSLHVVLLILYSVAMQNKYCTNQLKQIHIKLTKNGVTWVFCFNI